MENMRAIYSGDLGLASVGQRAILKWLGRPQGYVENAAETVLSRTYRLPKSRLS